MPPPTPPDRSIPPYMSHYYGDSVRILMGIGSGLMLISLPLVHLPLPQAFPIAIAAALVIVAFAAFTSPLKAWILGMDALLSAAVAIFYEMLAYLIYTTDLVAFVLNQTIAIIFLIAFYFSVKTYRAMVLHQIVGPPDNIDEYPHRPSEEEIVENSPIYE